MIIIVSQNTLEVRGFSTLLLATLKSCLSQKVGSWIESIPFLQQTPRLRCMYTHRHDDNEAGWNVCVEDVVTQAPLESKHHLQAREVSYQVNKLMR